MGTVALCKFCLWKLTRTVFGNDFSSMTVLCKTMDILGLILFLAGAVIFVTAPQWGTSNYDYTVKLDAPQPILAGSTLIAANDRVYVFCEEMCAVNVYHESGEFLFCVRGVRNQNGRAYMFLSGTGINILSRNHVLYQFDENGTYCGEQHDSIYVPKDVWQGNRSIVENGDTIYLILLNKVYQKTSSGRSVFASTPLYLYFIKSTGFGWLIMVLGTLLRISAEHFHKKGRRKR